MNNKVKFELDREGVRELLKSQEAKDMCLDIANAALTRLNSGYSVSCHTGRNRVNASVHADTAQARQDNLKNNTILKAVR